MHFFVHLLPSEMGWSDIGCISLNIFPQGTVLLKHRHTHTHAESPTAPGLPDNDLIPGKGRKSPDRLICVISCSCDQRQEGGCFMPEVIDRTYSKSRYRCIHRVSG